MSKVERYDQSHVKFHSREPCVRIVILNPHTSYKKERQCRKDAQFKIDGELLCSQHAGQTLLEKALL